MNIFSWYSERVYEHRSEAVEAYLQGPDVQAMAGLLAQHKPRLYITNSVFHNPTGAVLSPIVTHRVLKLAEDHDLLIIEDDIFADLAQNTSPLLASFDGLNRVIHTSAVFRKC